MLLSLVVAEYLSASLYHSYHDSGIFRTLTGFSPNKISDLMQKLSWALICLSSWYMLWKLDLFFTKKPPPSTHPKEDVEDSVSTRSKGEKERSEQSQQAEEDEGVRSETQEEPKGKPDATREAINPEDLKFAKVLEVENEEDPEAIKSSYRKKIAQYHPDRVRAMGPEIREVAESKAKEINEAYEHFRKKFKNL